MNQSIIHSYPVNSLKSLYPFIHSAYPLSENTVLVTMQLFSNLLSALFIPFFQSVRNFGLEGEDGFERPQYTFSFYLLIVVHAIATVIFATFNGSYKRLEQESKRKGDRRSSVKSDRYHDIEHQSLLK